MADDALPALFGSPCPSEPFLRVLSFGGGTQSTAMLLMGLEGRFGPPPQAAVFADTRGEPSYVYDWVRFVASLVAPFPIYVVSAGDLAADYLGGRRRAAIPAFSTSSDRVVQDGEDRAGRLFDLPDDASGVTLPGRPIMMSRFCSVSYKVEPIRRKTRELVGPKGSVEQWIGISTDEAHRGFKPSGRQWITHRYPLLEAGLSREACDAYIVERTGKRAPKSACLYCPFQSDGQWLQKKVYYPAIFEQGCAFDDAIRDLDGDDWDRPRFLHRSMTPLRQVVLRHEEQGVFALDQFGNECEGVCGV